MTGYVRFLEELSASDGERAGGKAANLGELVRAGLPVPPGFVLTTEAYSRCVPPPDLSALTPDDLAALEPVSSRIRSAIEDAQIPADLTAEVSETYRRMGLPAVAVRSSATAEDLPEASFAGQQETFLDVEGDDALLQAVRGCWASLWTDRAIRYRAERGIDQSSVAMAVLVQAMAPHEISGVVFTMDPITGTREELVINAAPGMGEKLVAGEVVPDQWHARRPDGAVISFAPARREWEGRRANPFLRSTPPLGSLSSGQIKELVRLALLVEEHFSGAPQDIEWSYGEGRFHILQARPVTASS